MNSDVLDTRSPFRVRQREASSDFLPTPSETQGFPAGLVVFRQLVRELLRAPRRDRAAALDKVVSHIRASREPVGCVNHLLFECATNGGTDGLDIAIDVLAQVGAPALVATELFRKADFPRWKQQPLPCHSVNDDVWYALLRGVCRSDLPWIDAFLAVLRTIRRQTPSGIKDAAVRALGDLAERTPEQIRLFRELLMFLVTQGVLAPPIKATVEEVLRDMED